MRNRRTKMLSEHRVQMLDTRWKNGSDMETWSVVSDIVDEIPSLRCLQQELIRLSIKAHQEIGEIIDGNNDLHVFIHETLYGEHPEPKTDEPLYKLVNFAKDYIASIIEKIKKMEAPSMNADEDSRATAVHEHSADVIVLGLPKFEEEARRKLA